MATTTKGTDMTTLTRKSLLITELEDEQQELVDLLEQLPRTQEYDDIRTGYLLALEDISDALDKAEGRS